MGLIDRAYAEFLRFLLPKIGKKVSIGPGSQIHPLAIIQPGTGWIDIGAGANIHRGAMLLTYNGKISLGSNVSVNPYTILYGHGGLEIGNDVRIAAHTVIIPADHIFDDCDKPIVSQGETRRGIRVGNDVWIGAGVQILDGADIAEGCVIGAGSVVKGTTEPFSIYAGVPACRIRPR